VNVTADFLAEQVLLAYGGPAWHGAALAENLAGLTAAEAAAHPLAGAHSVWEIVLHLSGWTSEVQRRLEGGAPGLPEEGDWPEVSDPSARAWPLAVDRLAAAHDALAAAIRRFPDARWREWVGEVPDAPLGTGVTYAAMISGLIQHDGYHGGQIGLLRRALRPG
jgi:uncharacterized damage-inducible protein DinB